MAKIIPFRPDYSTSNKPVQQKDPIEFPADRDYSCLYLHPEADSFELEGNDFEDDIEPSSYSIQEVVELAGEKRTDEIFETFLSRKSNGIKGKISPPEADAPLKESLAVIWGKDKDSKETRKAKLSELSRTKRAFLALEREASKNFEEKTGKKANIKIKVRTEDDEAYLTDILDEQMNFYKKDRISATIGLIGQKISSKFNSFAKKNNKWWLNERLNKINKPWNKQYSGNCGRWNCTQ